MGDLSQVLPGLFEPSEDPRRGSARKSSKVRNRRRRRRALITAFLVLLVVGGGAGGFYLGLAPVVRQLMAPKDYPGPGTGEVTVKVPAGASGRTIGGLLQEADVVKTQLAFVEAFQLNPEAASIQPGTYALRSQMSATSALELLLDPRSRLQTTVTVPEGKRVGEILDLLARTLQLPRTELLAASTSPAVGLPPASLGKPEGFLFPATYTFEPDVTAVQAVRAMVSRAEAAHAELGLTQKALRTVVIKASVVQAEAGDPVYMGKVARVIDNRLAQGTRLQMDSTVSYAVQRFGVTTTPAERASVSRFNTYRYPGLPVGPISNPGEAALKAVLAPTPGRWLFFVTTNPSTGLTKFAETAAQHEAQRREFQAWLRAQP